LRSFMRSLAAAVWRVAAAVAAAAAMPTRV